MARVTVEDCIEKIPNRFELVLTAGQRARAIQKGEIVLSKKVLDLGYEIGIVKPDGNIFKFKKDKHYQMFNNWKKNYKLGDARLHNILPSHPFRIINV